MLAYIGDMELGGEGRRGEVDLVVLAGAGVVRLEVSELLPQW